MASGAGFKAVIGNGTPGKLRFNFGWLVCKEYCPANGFKFFCFGAGFKVLGFNNTVDDEFFVSGITAKLSSNGFKFFGFGAGFKALIGNATAGKLGIEFFPTGSKATGGEIGDKGSGISAFFSKATRRSLLILLPLTSGSLRISGSLRPSPIGLSPVPRNFLGFCGAGCAETLTTLSGIPPYLNTRHIYTLRWTPKYSTPGTRKILTSRCKMLKASCTVMDPQASK